MGQIVFIYGEVRIPLRDLQRTKNGRPGGALQEPACAIRARILTSLRTDGRRAVDRTTIGTTTRLASEKMGQPGDRKLTHKTTDEELR